MNPRVSIVVPSLGKVKDLSRLIASVAEQSFTETYEMILCVTGHGEELEKALPRMALPNQLRVVESRRPGISVARNLGISIARGDVILFLDEDCYLPHSQYLRNLSDFHLQNPTASGGGLYLTRDANFGSSFYNYMCNAWVKSHSSQDGSAGVLLGGCCFYPRELIQRAQIAFPEHKPRAGEEKDFNLEVLKIGHGITLDPRWSVYHGPDYGFDDLVSRAWVQGLNLDRHAIIPRPQNWRRFARHAQNSPLEFVKFLPMTVAYSLLGRAACVSKIFHRRM